MRIIQRLFKATCILTCPLYPDRGKSRSETPKLSLSIHPTLGTFLQCLQESLAGCDSEIIPRLEIEIIETIALKDVITVRHAIRKCRTMGVRVMLDDFGSGFSSLVRLNHLAVDDLSFVSEMLTDSEDMAIIEDVVGLPASYLTSRDY